MNYTAAADTEVQFDFSLVNQNYVLLFYIILVLTYLSAEGENRNIQYIVVHCKLVFITFCI